MQHPRLAIPLLVAALAIGTAGCGWELPGVGAGNPNGGAQAVPPAPGGGGGGIGGGGNVGGGNVGGGIDPAPDDPGAGMRPSIESPVPGQVNPMPVSVWKLEPSIDGRQVTVLLSWWSGPAPCSVLDSVRVVRDGTTITMTPLEGSAPGANGQVACPAIAMLRGTIVDLGELEPGTWTLVANGDLAPVQITVR